MTLSSQHHSFDIKIAATYGIEEAILIHHFQHWIRINKSLKRNFHEGSTWSYQTIDEIAAHFPYIGKDRIINILEKLCTGKSRFSKNKEKEFEPVLKKGNFNKSKYDRTIWYAFCDDTKWILWEHKMEIGETQNQECVPTTPIPDTIPDTITHTEEPPPYPPEGGPPPGGADLCGFGKFVKLGKKEHETLCLQYGSQAVSGLIDEINDYLASTGKKPYKDYAAVIRTWARRRNLTPSEAQDPEVLPSGSSKKVPPRLLSPEEQDIQWLENIRKGNKDIIKLQNNLRMYYGDGFIQFPEIADAKFYFGDHGFRAKVENTLRKLDIYLSTEEVIQ